MRYMGRYFKNAFESRKKGGDAFEMDDVLALGNQMIGDQSDRDEVSTEDPIQLLSV